MKDFKTWMKETTLTFGSPAPAPVAPPKPAPTAPPEKSPTTPSKPDPFKFTPPDRKAQPVKNANPAPPEVKPETKPETVPSEPQKSPDPFKFTPPDRKAQPVKNHLLFQEAYADEVEEPMRWSQLVPDTHRLHKHPILGSHGEELDRDSFDMTSARLSRRGHDARAVAFNILGTLQEILRLEGPHKKELEDLAKEVVSSAWGISKDQLDGKIVPMGGVAINKASELGGEDSGEMTPELEKLVHARMTHNALIQGAGVKGLLTLHELAQEELNRTDWGKKLLELYHQFSHGVHSLYWMIDFVALAEGFSKGAIGSETLDDKGRVDAKGIAFPVLCHELFKGVAEGIAGHFLAQQDPETQKKIVYHADKLEDEPYFLRIGPALWDKFVGVMNRIFPDPRDTFSPANEAHGLMALVRMDPDGMHKLMRLTVRDPSKAADLMKAELKKLGIKVPESGGVEPGTPTPEI